MARNNYSAGKRQRERERERKKKDKAQRRADNRAESGDVPTATADELQGGNLMSVEEVMRSLEPGGGEDKEARTIPSRLFVGGLDWRVNVEQLRKEFEKFGGVSDAIVVLDRDTGDSRGFGFVTMADRKDAAEVIRKLNGTQLEGRTLVVRQAEERRSGGPGGGRR